MELTVTEALVKLKLNNSKIEDNTQRLIVGYLVTEGNKNVPAGFKDSNTFKQEADSRLDTVSGLVNFRDKLKSAIVLSNAATKVKIGTAEMTVAEAIERKQSIKYKKALLEKLRKDYTALTVQADRNNAMLETRADEVCAKLPEQVDRNEFRVKWIHSNRTNLVASEKVKDQISLLQEEINNFESNVDTALSVSNSKTLISVAD